MAKTHPTFAKIAEEVKTLHDRDEQLSKERAKNKIEQRDVRLKIGHLVKDVPEHLRSELSARTGYTVARLKDFERCRLAWPEGSFPNDANYTALEELSRDPNRFTKIKAGMSKRDAREAKGGKVDTPSRWAPEVKTAFLREALSDPEVARQIASDVEIRSTIAKAENEAYRERRSQRDLDPSSKAMRQTVSGDDIVRQIIGARYKINRALDQAMDEGLTNAKRSEALEALAELTTTIAWFESYLNSGDTSFEQALDELLRSQEN